MKWLCAGLLLIAIGIVATAATRNFPSSVARAGNEQIHLNDLETAINRALAIAGKTIRELSENEKRDLQISCLDGLIRDSLLRQRAIRAAVPPEEMDAAVALFRAQFESEERMNSALARRGTTIEEIREMVATHLRTRKWMENQLRPINVTDAEARKFYQENLEHFQMPERVRASHLLVLISADMPPEMKEQKRLAAGTIAMRAKAGEMLAQLAVELSDDPGAKANQGDLGYFSRERMEAPFVTAAFNLNVGEISEPVRTKFGYHIIQVTDRKPARALSFEEARPLILRRLQDDRRRSAVAELLRSVRRESVVAVNLPDRWRAAH